MSDRPAVVQESGLLEKRGAALACYVLGRCFHLGTGVPVQPEKARELYNTVRSTECPCVLYSNSLDCAHTHTHRLPSMTRTSPTRCTRRLLWDNCDSRKSQFLYRLVDTHLSVRMPYYAGILCVLNVVY